MMTDPNNNQNPHPQPQPQPDATDVRARDLAAELAAYFPESELSDGIENFIEPFVRPAPNTWGDGEMPEEEAQKARQSALIEFYEWAADRDKRERKLHINYWMSSRDVTFGSWWIEFKDRQMLDPERQMAFYIRFLEAGERERVLVVKQTEEGLPFPYHESMGISYSQHLKQVAHYRDRGMHFLDGISGSIRKQIITSHLCYYDSDGRLTEGEINDVAQLLQEVRAADIEYAHSRDVYPNHPIKIYTDWQTPDYDGSGSSLVICIKLNTNIWFPQVCSRFHRDIENESGNYSSEDATNNLELARCHTPRFNRFLAEVKQLTLEFGGEWELGDLSTPESEINEDGILLPEISA
jgi:hypothetical protein